MIPTFKQAFIKIKKDATYNIEDFALVVPFNYLTLL